MSQQIDSMAHEFSPGKLGVLLDQDTYIFFALFLPICCPKAIVLLQPDFQVLIIPKPLCQVSARYTEKSGLLECWCHHVRSETMWQVDAPLHPNISNRQIIQP